MMQPTHNDSFKAMMYMYVRSLVCWTTVYHVYHALCTNYCKEGAEIYP